MLSLTVGILWLLSWSSAIEGIRLHTRTLDLHAWLYLKARMTELARETRDGIFAKDARQSLSHTAAVDPTQPARGPEDATWVAKPIEVDAAWPSARKHPIRLEPELFHAEWDEDFRWARAYRIVPASPSGVSELPLSDYRVVFFPDRFRPTAEEGHNPVVAPIEEATLVERGSEGLRQLEQVAVALDRPASWDEVILHLARHGFTGSPADLAPKDDAVAALRAESDLRASGEGVHVLGVEINLRSFFTAVGLILAVIAFAMLGPVLVLRESRATASSVSWILTIKRGASLPRRLLEGVVILVTAAWSIFPLAILYLQLSTASEFHGLEVWSLWLGAVGLVFASIVHGMASLELWAHRRGSEETVGSE